MVKASEVVEAIVAAGLSIVAVRTVTSVRSGETA
jgi:hypothetical protein